MAFTALGLAFGLALGTAESPSGFTTAKAKRPNIVVLMTDDQTVESMRVMSNVRRLLVRRGTNFTNSFVSLANCCPSRATFLTGQYAHNHRVLSNDPPRGGYGKLDHSNTLAVWLQRAGYRTAHIGKYLNHYGERDPREIPPGWSEWYGSIDPSTYRFYGYTLNENGRLATYDAYQTDLYARKASALVRRFARSSRPFFLSVAFAAPHHVHGEKFTVPAPRHRGRYAGVRLPRPPSFDESDVSDKPARLRNAARLDAGAVTLVTEMYRSRLESLVAVDEAVARIVGALRAARELNRTLVVFTSDNGFFQGEHRIREQKNMHYEPAIRVPLVMRGPGAPRRVRVSQLVANIDLAPTITDAANASPGRVMDGRSLLPLLRNRRMAWRRDLLIERSPKERYNPVKEQILALRTTRYLYAQWESGERELYDLRRDPHELLSLHADPRYTRQLRALRARLARLRRCSGRTCR